MDDLKPEELKAASKGPSRAWEEAQVFAVENGLEYYLDNPLELNRLIMKLVRLEDKLLAFQMMKDCEGTRPDDRVLCSHKEYAQGKFLLYFAGRKEYAEKAKGAFSRAVDVRAFLRYDLVIHYMKKAGVPDDVIRQCLETYHIIDECYSDEKCR